MNKYYFNHKSSKPKMNRNGINSLAVIIAIMLGFFSSNAQIWNNVGTAGFSADSAWWATIAIDTAGLPCVAYVDNSNGDKVTVKRFDGTAWNTLGTAGFSAGMAEYTSIAIGKDNTIYVAYDDWGNAGKATVMKFNGTTWTPVGIPGFSPGETWFTSLALGRNDTPYVVFMDYSAADLYSEQAHIMKFNGTTWATVGANYPSTQAANFTAITMDTAGRPYVVFQDYANSNKASVIRLNNNYWQRVGSPIGFSDGKAMFTTIAIDKNNTPYVAYMDTVNGFKATVKKFNGTTWITVGTEGITPDSAFYPTLALDGNGTPYVVFQDGAHGGKASVMKFDGINWVMVGSSGFSGSTSYYNSIAIRKDGEPFVSFEDGANAGKLTVMKPGNWTGITSIENDLHSEIKVYPNPNGGTFNMQLSSKFDTVAQVNITNILGEKVKAFSIKTNMQTPVLIDVPKGLYVISAIVNNQKIIYKLLIE